MLHENTWYQRTELLVGEENFKKLSEKHILVAGQGGVGSFASEFLVRAGIGKMTIIDGDIINPTNINRQLPATSSTVGKEKAEVMGQRLRDINPDLELKIINEYIRDDRMLEILQSDYDYVIDAIDTLSPKVDLIYHSVNMNHKIVTSMGAGGKFDPSEIKITDISETYNCRLARMVRKKLHQLGIREGFKAVFSSEMVDPKRVVEVEGETNKRSNVGTISYMPALFGLNAASVVIRELID